MDTLRSHNIVKRFDSAVGNLVNNVEENLPRDGSYADWLIPLAIFIAVIIIIAIVVLCVRWCISRNKYKFLKNKDVPAEPVWFILLLFRSSLLARNHSNITAASTFLTLTLKSFSTADYLSLRRVHFQPPLKFIKEVSYIFQSLLVIQMLNKMVWTVRYALLERFHVFRWFTFQTWRTCTMDDVSF